MQSAKKLKEKLAKIDAVTDSLLTTAMKAALTGDTVEYSLDDGQMVTKQTFRNVEDIEKAITAFEKLRNMYSSRLNGRVRRIVDSKNFPNTYGTY